MVENQYVEAIAFLMDTGSEINYAF